MEAERRMDHVWENQRCYGLLGWFPPHFDLPQFTDGSGAAVQFKEGEDPNSSNNWRCEVSLHTDSEGWLYSTGFSRIGVPREGGRASKRATDSVRRRKWMTVAEGQVNAPSIPARKKRSLMLYRGLRAFVGMFSEVLQRRQIWEVLPWDPGAWLVVHAEHQEYIKALLSLEAAIKKCALSTEAVSKELMLEIECGAVHSRAAYGYVLWAGHMESVDAVVMLHTVHNKYFDPVTGASGEANRKAVCALADIEEEDVLMAEWGNSQYRPCHYVAIDRKRRRVMVVIRGSLETGDVITDVTGQPLSVTIGGTSGTVHIGVMSAATYVQCSIQDALKEAAEKVPGWPLLITGHSLGGGVAVLLTMLLREEGSLNFKTVRGVGIGPASVVSEELAEQCRGFFTSVINRSDVVPRLSCASVEALLLELTNASPATKAVQGLVQSATSALQSLKEKLFEDSFKELPHYVPSARGGSMTKPGFKGLMPLFQDEDAIKRAAKAAQDALDVPQIKVIEMQTPKKTPSQLPEVQAEIPVAEKTASSKDPKAMDNLVFPGGSGSFTPMHPAGDAYWIISVLEDGEKSKKKQEPDWWDKLQSWGKEKLFRSGSQTDLSEGIGSGELKGCASRDLEWIDKWIKERLQEVLDEGEGKQNDPEIPVVESVPCEPPRIDADMARPTNHSEEEKQDQEAAALPRRVVLLEADSKTFERILVNPDMINDHLPNAYLASIQMLVKDM
ncbi:hypothetical protein BSKO_00898 [Bryopsis sp. KO-2023]|nr:hypothetical protein BSKO_00898 [Bryopsis sp. KO-2023]